MQQTSLREIHRRRKVSLNQGFDSVDFIGAGCGSVATLRHDLMGSRKLLASGVGHGFCGYHVGLFIISYETHRVVEGSFDFSG